MFTNDVVVRVKALICDIDDNFDVRVREFVNGEFGDLTDLDFSNGRIIGHVAFWSSGMIFYGAIDDTKSEDFYIVDETYMDAADKSSDDILSEMHILFEKIRDFCHKSKGQYSF